MKNVEKCLTASIRISHNWGDFIHLNYIKHERMQDFSI